MPVEQWDAVLVGGGVTSATLGVLLAELQPEWRIAVVERLDEAGLESSSAWNNAGTGHAGLCEFDYTPRRPDGTVDPAGAVRIGEQFAASLVLWARLVERGVLGPPEAFVRSVPHLGLGRGADGGAYLRARYEALRGSPLFAGQEFSDVDFGVLTRQLRAPWVFVGAGGRTLPLLQSARGPEVRRYGAFPISGRFLRTDRPELVAAHRGTVYGHAEPGVPAICEVAP